MIELLKNCSNGNDVSTYLVIRDTGFKKIVKIAATPVGMRNLRREVGGWGWYQEMRYPKKEEPICRIVQQGVSFLKIELEFMEGARADCRKGLEKNRENIRKAIEHYCEIWPSFSDSTAPLHGDLSLDNIIYNADGVHMIDWEHFHEKGAPWGFDPLYLLFETLFLRIRNNKRPSRAEVAIIADSIGFLNRKQELQSQMIDHPLRFLVEFITVNHRLWCEELPAFQNKFPILAFTADRVLSIDNTIRARLKEGM
jgi:hypothetical protein